MFTSTVPWVGESYDKQKKEARGISIRASFYIIINTPQSQRVSKSRGCAQSSPERSAVLPREYWSTSGKGLEYFPGSTETILE